MYYFPQPCTLKTIWIFTAIFSVMGKYRLDKINTEMNKQLLLINNHSDNCSFFFKFFKVFNPALSNPYTDIHTLYR